MSFHSVIYHLLAHPLLGGRMAAEVLSTTSRPALCISFRIEESFPFLRLFLENVSLNPSDQN